MQPRLSFQPISADEAAVQRDRFAQEAAAHPRTPAPIKRPVGRPKRPLDSALILASAATAVVPSDDAPAQKKARGPYTNWFTQPALVREIVAAYKRHGGAARATVDALRRGAPDKRFERLSHSTVSSWFDTHLNLLPKLQQQLDQSKPAARGHGNARALAAEPALQEEIKATLIKMRGAGAPLNSRVVRWVMHAVIEERQPALLLTLTLSQSFINRWVRDVLHWSWRSRTTAASKLPIDWEDQGVQMAMRVAALMEMEQVHPSLVVNMDQTGTHLVPAARWTYNAVNSSSVGVVGAEDKRQITVCVASSLDGSLLPLQLIFQGKTPRSLPPATPTSIAAKAHRTFSPNHWSNQTTMREWITEVLLPYATESITRHRLPSDSRILLLLDAWSVHKSEEFRFWLRNEQPRVRLVFVPANCTSRLQVADVALQRPFKHGLTSRFNEWAAKEVRSQVVADQAVTLKSSMSMKIIKPLALQWCIESWTELRDRRALILAGWKKCCTSLFDVHDPARRNDAVKAVAKRQLDELLVPDEDEQDSDETDFEESESDSEPILTDAESELDLALPKAEGRRSSRPRPAAAASFSYFVNSQALHFSSDSDHM